VKISGFRVYPVTLPEIESIQDSMPFHFLQLHPENHQF